MIEEKSKKFLRIQNLVIIGGIVIFIVGILVMFSDLNKRIRNLEETVYQLTFSQEKVIPPEGVIVGEEKVGKVVEESVQPPPIEGWKEVTFLGGEESQKTQPFFISGEQWRIRWEVEFYSDKPGSFSFKIYRQQDNRLISDPLSFSSFDILGMTKYSAYRYIYEGKADYYLDVEANDLKNWQIKIESIE